MTSRLSSSPATDAQPLAVLFIPAVASNPYQRLLAGALATQGVRVRQVRANRHLLLPLIEAALILGRRPDVVHIHWTHRYLYWRRSPHVSRLLSRRLLMELRLLRRAGLRIVWTMHNIAAHDRPDSYREMRVSRQILELCDVALVHCEAARDQVVSTLELDRELRDRILVIPHANYIGTYPDRVERDEARESMGIAADQKSFLFFGRIRRYKGGEELLEAFARIPDRKTRLILAGAVEESSLRAAVESTAQRDDRVMLRLDHIADEDVQLYFRSADVAVLPFRDVLTSGSVILAMSFGLPVIAPRLGCIPETLGAGAESDEVAAAQAQLLYDPAVEDGLVRAMTSALEMDLPAIGRRNRQLVERIDWDEMARLTIELAYLSNRK